MFKKTILTFLYVFVMNTSYQFEMEGWSLLNSTWPLTYFELTENVLINI